MRYLKFFLLAGLLNIMLNVSSAQDRYFTKSGKVQFDATTPSSPEKVGATTNALICVVDIKTGLIQFSIVMKSFEFKNALMQEHFNENYVESNKFPKAEFKGNILNNTEINYSKDGSYKARVKGQLSIHGVSKEVETEGYMIVKGGKINANATFTAGLKDYDIAVPGLVADKVANYAKISLDCSLEPLK